MARSPSADRAPSPRLDPAAGRLLLDVAERAIRDGLAGRRPTIPDPGTSSDALRQRAGTFVTVRVGGALNGCIGSIEASEPIVCGVAHHAWSAAFDDPRLPPLRHDDIDRLSIEISVLSPLVEAAAGSRDELLAALRQGVDGLVIEAGRHRGVFLPSVWETLSTPDRFVSELFVKAGLAGRYWGSDVRAWTFTAAKITGTPGGERATVR